MRTLGGVEERSPCALKGQLSNVWRLNPVSTLARTPSTDGTSETFSGTLSVPTLCVIPALYALVKQWQLRRESPPPDVVPRSELEADLLEHADRDEAKRFMQAHARRVG